MRGVSARLWLPRFWRGEAGLPGAILGAALLPAEVVFRLGTRVRKRLYRAGVLRVARASIPVVSVGNLTVGGSGKTPVCGMIASRLRAMGRRPAVILRGYGADEIAVHREINPGIRVEAAVRRIEAVEAAARAGCDCAVLDDGFQHIALARDLDIAIVAAEQWTAPRRLLPRGLWREPLPALQRAGLVLVTRKSASAAEAERIAEEIARVVSRVRLGIAHLTPSGLRRLSGAGGLLPVDQLRGREVLAIATLADPVPFLEQLRVEGLLAESSVFPDHHEFTDADVVAIVKAAGDRPIVMTRKEAVKLRGRVGSNEAFVLEQEVWMERGERDLEEALDVAVGRIG